MLTAPPRRGATLAELLVALTLAAIVLGTAGSTLLRQQRTASSLGRAAGSDAQVRAALGALAVELSALAAGSGDLAPGQATDTAVQLRSLIASGLSCADAASSATFAGEDDGSGGALAGSAPRAGDSLWWFGGQSSGWRARRIVSVDSVSMPCLLTGLSAPARRVVIAEPDSIPYGAVLRVTRPLRYAFYRSGDGSWQLGVREWSEATGRFVPPQPVAGPFLMQVGAARTGFHFYDSEGVGLDDAGAGVPADRVARVRVSVIVPGGIGGGDPAGGPRRDSMDVALQQAGIP